MARYKREIIKLNEESLETLLNEIYRQSCEMRTKVISDLTKMRKKLYSVQDEEIGSIQVISKALVDLIKAEKDSIDKKINVAKVIKEVISTPKKSTEEEVEDNISDDRKKAIQELIKQTMEK